MSEKHIMISPEKALRGRDTPFTVDDTHFVNQSSISAAPTTDQAEILIGMGCFWGAERLFWQLDGVVSTSVGYSGGYTENPTYEEVCSGKTGHAEVVRVVYS
ncbi:peptide-methionine (S)-S-oxide reductase, partial [Vibrio campbellii]